MNFIALRGSSSDIIEPCAMRCESRGVYGHPNVRTLRTDKDKGRTLPSVRTFEDKIKKSSITLSEFILGKINFHINI